MIYINYKGCFNIFLALNTGPNIPAPPPPPPLAPPLPDASPSVILSLGLSGENQ